MTNWPESTMDQFLSLIDEFWPSELRETSGGHKKGKIALWKGRMAGFPNMIAMEVMREIYMSQDIKRAPSIERVSSMCSDRIRKSGDQNAPAASTLAAVIPRLHKDVKPIYEERLRGERDPRISFHEYRRRVESGVERIDGEALRYFEEHYPIATREPGEEG